MTAKEQTSIHAGLLKKTTAAYSMERETGIEPALVAWKATVLPLNYSRSGILQYIQFKKTETRCWREVDYSGHPALRPSGASLRLFKIAPGDFVEPNFHFGGSHPPQ